MTSVLKVGRQVEKAKRYARCVKKAAQPFGERDSTAEGPRTTAEEEEKKGRNNSGSEEEAPTALRLAASAKSAPVLFLPRRISIALHTIAILRGA